MYTLINRIRLEFKEAHTLLGCYWWGVLIESDWNLKLHGKAAFCETGTVLIESDWNLKHVALLFVKAADISINRIRLEFKGCTSFACHFISSVLIESDWNLKHAMMDIDIAAISINRIRLEFEVHPKIKSFVEKYLY